MDRFYKNGTQRVRPYTRSQTRDFAALRGTIQRYRANVVDRLPDEVLLLVLARLEIDELLPLRLVCRRWSELVLTAPVWRHRVVSSRDSRALVHVRLVAALDYLEIRDSFLKYGKALLEGGCQVRCLRMDSRLTFLEAIVETQRGLQELDICLGRADVKFIPDNVLGFIDKNLPGLRALRIEQPQVHDYNFQGFRALRVLRCRGVADQAVFRLLELCAATLEEVDTLAAGALPLLAACPNLRAAIVTARPGAQLSSGEPAGLAALAGLASLRALTVHCAAAADVAALAEARLDALPHLPELRLELLHALPEDNVLRPLARSGALSRVTSLEVHSCAVSRSELLGALRGMPALDSLTLLDVRGADDLLAAWDETVARGLSHLTVRKSDRYRWAYLGFGWQWYHAVLRACKKLLQQRPTLTVRLLGKSVTQ